jgi:hypothetical protein
MNPSRSSAVARVERACARLAVRLERQRATAARRARVRALAPLVRHLKRAKCPAIAGAVAAAAEDGGASFVRVNGHARVARLIAALGRRAPVFTEAERCAVWAFRALVSGSVN